MRPSLLQRAAQPKAEATRFIDHMDGVPLREQPLDPGHELPWREALRRPQRGVIVLRNDHVRLGMNIEPELDHRGLAVSLGRGSRGCGRPFVMNDCLFNHTAGELPSSPASFHAIYALQRTGGACR